jgi:hypothetical protein
MSTHILFKASDLHKELSKGTLQASRYQFHHGVTSLYFNSQDLTEQTLQAVGEILAQGTCVRQTSAPLFVCLFLTEDYPFILVR